MTAYEDDPVPEHFLKFLARDIEQRPEHLQVLGAAFVERLRSLVGGAEIDLDAPMPAED